MNAKHNNLKNHDRECQPKYCFACPQCDKFWRYSGFTHWQCLFLFHFVCHFYASSVPTIHLVCHSLFALYFSVFSSFFALFKRFNVPIVSSLVLLLLKHFCWFWIHNQKSEKFLEELTLTSTKMFTISAGRRFSVKMGRNSKQDNEKKS